MINSNDTDSLYETPLSLPQINKIHLIKQYLNLTTSVIEWNLIVSLTILCFTMKLDIRDGLYLKALLSTLLSAISLFITFGLCVIVIPTRVVTIYHRYMHVLVPLVKHLSFIPTVFTVASFVMRILVVADNVQMIMLIIIGIYFIITLSLQFTYDICSEINELSE